jgi:hypothetical protein
VLHHQRKTSPGFQGKGLLLQALLGTWIGGLAPQAQAMHRLGRQAQMTHDRDPHAHHAINRRQRFRLRPLQLHRRCRAVLQHLASGGHGVIQAALITETGEIADHERRFSPHPSQPPTHRPAVVQHLLQGDREGGGVTQGCHGQGIPHQHSIDSSFAHDGR